MAQNMSSAEVIGALFYKMFFHKINRMLEQRFELLLHLQQIFSHPSRIRFKGHKDIHVAIRTKVIPQNGPEQGEFPDLPSAAEFRNCLSCDPDSMIIFCASFGSLIFLRFSHFSSSPRSLLNRPSRDLALEVPVFPLINEDLFKRFSDSNLDPRNSCWTTGSRFPMSRQMTGIRLHPLPSLLGLSWLNISEILFYGQWGVGQ